VRRRTRSLSTVVPAVAAVILLGATPATARPAGGTTPTGSITVSAAASLTEAFTALGDRFERRNPRADVTFNFGSSSSLVSQIQAGAPADVFAAADLATMDRLVADGEVATTPTPFARNTMVIAVKPGNPEELTGVDDLADAGTISLCGAAAPCGVYAARVLERAGVTVPERRITRGADARATVGAVARGDAAAAIVYVTDVEAAGRSVAAVAIPAAQNVIAVYPIAPLAASSNRRLARAFVDFVTSPAGQRTLAAYGFLPA